MGSTADEVWVAEADSHRIGGSRYGGYMGYVVTKDGIVTVEQSSHWFQTPWAVSFDYSLNGRQHRRTIKMKKPYSRRWLVTLARRFAVDVFEDFLEGICV